MRPGRSFRHLVQRHTVACYFALTFAASWTGAFLVAAPSILRGKLIPRTIGPLMFPAMLLGPSVMGIALTWILEGRHGLEKLFSRMHQFRFDTRWYLALLVPPVLILAVLVSLEHFVSSTFAPNRFLTGAAFGLIAGFFEEIGWMGFAFDKLLQTKRALVAAIALGLLWGLWHLPVIDYLGAATPHRGYLVPFFLAFIAVLTAMRCLISWIYVQTNSLPLCQLTHASSTASLVIFSPARVSPRQETLWYSVYAAALWLLMVLPLFRWQHSERNAQSIAKNRHPT